MMYLTARPRGRKGGRVTQRAKWKNKERPFKKKKKDLTFGCVCEADGDEREEAAAAAEKLACFCATV